MDKRLLAVESIAHVVTSKTCLSFYQDDWKEELMGEIVDFRFSRLERNRVGAL
jgi:hypothetical protein